jgi:hypothetical protein
MNRRTPPWILPAACVFALAALGLMVWSLLDPRPVPVIVAMSIGQVLGTVSFVAFLVVVSTDLRRVLDDDERAGVSGVSPGRKE